MVVVVVVVVVDVVDVVVVVFGIWNFLDNTNNKTPQTFKRKKNINENVQIDRIARDKLKRTFL